MSRYLHCAVCITFICRGLFGLSNISLQAQLGLHRISGFALESSFRDIRGIPKSKFCFTPFYQPRFQIRFGFPPLPVSRPFFRFHFEHSQGANSSMFDKYPAYLLNIELKLSSRLGYQVGFPPRFPPRFPRIRGSSHQITPVSQKSWFSRPFPALFSKSGLGAALGTVHTAHCY